MIRYSYNRLRLPACLITAVSVALAAGTLKPAAAQTKEQPAEQEQQSHGPIPMRDGRPLNLLFLQFVPELPDVLKRNTNRYDLQLDMINNMQIPAPGGASTVIEDNEYERLRFSWRHGLPGNTEFGMYVPIVWRSAGFMDAIIDAYHHMVALPANSLDVPAGRGSYPEYRSQLTVIDASGKVLINSGNGFGFGETLLTLKKQLTHTSSKGALAVRIGLKLPTGPTSQLLGSGHLDGGVSIDGRLRLGRELSVFGNIGWVALGKSNIALGTRPTTVQTLAGIEYRPNSRDSYILQVDGNGQFVTTGNDFADRSNVTATFGYRRKFDRHHSGFASFSEGGHIYNYHAPGLINASPDFTVSLGFTWLP